MQSQTREAICFHYVLLSLPQFANSELGTILGKDKTDSANGRCSVGQSVNYFAMFTTDAKNSLTGVVGTPLDN